MIVSVPDDKKAFALEPLNGGRAMHEEARERRMGGLGVPCAY